MYEVWTRHIEDNEAKAKFIAHIRGSKDVLDRLSQILDMEWDGLNNSEMSMKCFENPNWAFQQAYKNGYRACLAVIKNIVDIDRHPVEADKEDK